MKALRARTLAGSRNSLTVSTPNSKKLAQPHRTSEYSESCRARRGYAYVSGIRAWSWNCGAYAGSANAWRLVRKETGARLTEPLTKAYFTPFAGSQDPCSFRT